MTEFVLHVGPHKTGSTYIQLGLDQNFPALLRQGVYVPTEWRDSEQNPSHTGFVKKFDPESMPSLERTVAAWVADGYSKVVISAEDISGWPKDRLALLRHLFGTHACTVVFYVRRWSDLTASVWNEGVVHGGWITLPEFFVNTLRDPYRAGTINFGQNVDRLVSVFGPKSVRLVSYDTVIHNKRDLFEHFARKFLGVTGLAAPTDARANASFDRAEAEILRLLNLQDHLEGISPSARNAMAFRDKAGSLDLTPLKAAMKDFERFVELDDRKEPFATILERDRIRLAGHFVGPVPEKGVYPPKLVRVSYVASDCVIAPGFLDNLAKIRNKLHDAPPEPKAGQGKLLSLFGKRR